VEDEKGRDGGYRVEPFKGDPWGEELLIGLFLRWTCTFPNMLYGTV
jgi:hypothetical protein